MYYEKPGALYGMRRDFRNFVAENCNTIRKAGAYIMLAGAMPFAYELAQDVMDISNLTSAEEFIGAVLVAGGILIRGYARKAKQRVALERANPWMKDLFDNGTIEL